MRSKNPLDGLLKHVPKAIEAQKKINKDISEIQPADLNKIHDGSSILHEAVSGNANHLIKPLVSKGANVNIRGNNGETPLHAAVKSGNTSGAKKLLKQGADFNIANDRNQTPIQLAESIGNSDLIDLFKNAEKNFKNDPFTSTFRLVSGLGKGVETLMSHVNPEATKGIENQIESNVGNISNVFGAVTKDIENVVEKVTGDFTKSISNIAQTFDEILHATEATGNKIVNDVFGKIKTEVDKVNTDILGNISQTLKDEAEKIGKQLLNEAIAEANKVKDQVKGDIKKKIIEFLMLDRFAEFGISIVRRGGFTVLANLGLNLLSPFVGNVFSGNMARYGSAAVIGMMGGYFLESHNIRFKDKSLDSLNYIVGGYGSRDIEDYNFKKKFVDFACGTRCFRGISK
ncbi:MAG: hypothetical protein BGO27_06845 [Alphaproteobacteria bacterium 33-17]|nr:MAG: hypothetical protein BGO27_06845 [Alphaproteobacteria bacterium 33-17]